MAVLTINAGSFDLDPSAESARSAFGKVNTMMAELYAFADSSPQVIDVLSENYRQGYTQVNDMTLELYAAFGGVDDRQVINIGAYYGDLAADSLRAAFGKINAMMITLFANAADVGGNTAYGPQRSQTRPTGAVDILAGASIQTAVTNNPAGTTFWLHSGTFSITSSIVPKTGNTFVGEYGAILDGTSWSSSTPEHAAFQAHNADIDNVTIRNLVVQNMPQKGIHAFRDFASGWTVAYCEIAYCKDGISLSNGARVNNNYIHHNIGDPTNVDAGLRGGGYVFNEGTDIIVENNEISYNGPEQKSIDIGVITWRGNFVHHNYQGGIWVDGDGNGSTIENNIVEDQTVGIWYEDARGCTIRNNYVRRHTEQGLFLSTSKNNEVYGNTFEYNTFNIHTYADLDVVGLFAWSGDLANNNIHDNIIRTSGSGEYAALFTYAGSGTSATPYINNTKANNYSANTYYGDNLADFDWIWVTAKNFTQWQALPQDATSTFGLL